MPTMLSRKRIEISMTGFITAVVRAETSQKFGKFSGTGLTSQLHTLTQVGYSQPDQVKFRGLRF